MRTIFIYNLLLLSGYIIPVGLTQATPVLGQSIITLDPITTSIAFEGVIQGSIAYSSTVPITGAVNFPHALGDGRTVTITDAAYLDYPAQWTPMGKAANGLWETSRLAMHEHHTVLNNFSATFSGTSNGSITKPIYWCTWFKSMSHSAKGKCVPLVSADPSSIINSNPQPDPAQCTQSLAISIDGGEWEAGKSSSKFTTTPITITCNKTATMTIKYNCDSPGSPLCNIDTGGLTHNLGVAATSSPNNPYVSGNSITLQPGANNFLVADSILGHPTTPGSFTGTGVITTTYQ
ncbi:hypothetical protein DQY68_20655 [Salmonella enterica subsp. salamae]|nr:hypothetical protein [Salmonella enterica subsp. salamae]